MDLTSQYCLQKAVQLGEPYYSVRMQRRGRDEEKLVILHHSFTVLRFKCRSGGADTRLGPWASEFSGDCFGAITADGWILLNSIKC